MATNKRSAGWREATGDFFLSLLLRYFSYSNRTEHIRAIAHKRARWSCSTWHHMWKIQKESHLSTATPSAENAFCQARNSFWKRSQSQEKRQSRFWKQSFISVFWTLRRCFCFRHPDPFSAKLVFIIPGWAQTGRRCQRLTQSVDFKFLHIILSAIMKS